MGKSAGLLGAFAEAAGVAVVTLGQRAEQRVTAGPKDVVVPTSARRSRSDDHRWRRPPVPQQWRRRLA